MYLYFQASPVLLVNTIQILAVLPSLIVLVVPLDTTVYMKAAQILQAIAQLVITALEELPSRLNISPFQAISLCLALLHCRHVLPGSITACSSKTHVLVVLLDSTVLMPL